MKNAVLGPAVILAKMRAFMTEWMEELFLHERMPDIPVVMPYRRQVRLKRACNFLPSALLVGSPRGW